jgi:putative zinc finger/helix-turn-helix YgiT family protein
MKNNVVSFPTSVSVMCAHCGEQSARISYEDEKFPYGVGENQVTLTARVPVIQCDACGAQYTDGAAEVIRHAEVCRHLGRLAPDAVRAIRERYGLSQQEWATQTGLGIASVKRWETGNLIQNEATDRYLRLLINPDTFAKVIQMGERRALHENNFRFQTILPDVAYEIAPVFVLRKVHG